MSRETRTILVLLAVSLLGISALALMAHRYGKLLEHRTRPSGAPPASLSTQPRTSPTWTPDGAQASVDTFIEVRRDMRRELSAESERRPRGRTVREARQRALSATGMTEEEYATVRGLYRAWRLGRLERSSAVAGAFERRRTELGELDLGAYEGLDS
jgi:hypothetical protein